MKCQKEWEFCAYCGAEIVRFDDSSREKPIKILVESDPTAPKPRKIAVKVQMTTHNIPLIWYTEKLKKGAWRFMRRAQMENYPGNDEVLAAYKDALLQCGDLFRGDLRVLNSEMSQNLATFCNDAMRHADTTASTAALDHDRFRVKVAEYYLRALKTNCWNGKSIIGRWERSAQEFAEHVDVPLIMATAKDAYSFRGDTTALNALFAFLIAERKRRRVR
jgi:hypothetical protein